MEEKEKKEVDVSTNEPSTEVPKTEEVKEEVKAETPKEAGETKKKKKGGLVVILCLIIVAVLAAIFVPSLLKPKTASKKAETDATTVNSPYRMSGNGLENFDLYFLQLENNSKNMVYSPLSIKYALAMLNEGTDGKTHEQIRSVIGDYKAKKYNNNEHMSFANAMFVRNTFKDALKEDYSKTLQEKYGAEVTVDAFENSNNINSWISNKTFNLIGDLISDEKIQKLDFVLINALAIDMNWNNQLQCKQGREIPCMSYYTDYLHENYSDYIKEIYQDFDTIKFGEDDVRAAQIGASINKYDIIKELGEDKIREEVGKELQEYIDNGGEMCDQTYDEVLDTYMKELGANYKQVSQSTDFYFYDDNEVKVFAKDLKTYENTTLQYVAVMPKNGSLSDYVKDLDAKKLGTIVKNLKGIELGSFKDGVITKVHGNIPFFNYDYELNLMDDLKKIGIEDVFDKESADLSKMIKNDGTYISEASHKAKIEFSNDGIKAAAVTAFGGTGASSCKVDFDHVYEVPIEELDLEFTKPYMYIIRDKDSGEVWFVGTVYTPSK